MAALVVAITSMATAGVSGAAPQTQAIDGELLVAQGEDFATGASIMQTALRTDSGIVPVTLPESGEAATLALAGQRVKLLGSNVAETFAATSVSEISTETAAYAPAAASATPPRAMRIAVVLMRLPGTTAEPVTTAQAGASTFGASNSVAHWFSQMSGGQVSVSGTVFGYYDGVKSCDLSAQLAAGAAAATAGGYVASNFDHLVVYTPEQQCGFAGMGWVGEAGVFLNGSFNPGILEHELGHNLGLWHAGRYNCGSAPSSVGCLTVYGDDTDVMGNPYLNRGYSAQHKYMIGWLAAANVRTVTAGASTIALTASAGPTVAGSTQLIHVRAADGALYAIDRRASVGYDTGLSGVWIRRVELLNTDDTQLVMNGPLRAGATFTDRAHHVTITTLTDSGPTASVRVCVGTCPVSSQSFAAVVSPPVTARNIASGSKSSAANSSIRLTVPTGRGVATGHTVVVAMYASKTSGAASCSDSRGNVYTVNVNRVGAQRLVVCSANVRTALVAGGTITVRYPSFSGASIASATDFSGLKASARVDQTSANGGSGRAIDSRLTATTARAREVVFSVVAYRGTPAFTSGTGYTRVGAASYFSRGARMTLLPAFKIVSTTGSYRVQGTLSSAQVWRAAVITLFRA